MNQVNDAAVPLTDARAVTHALAVLVEMVELYAPSLRDSGGFQNAKRALAGQSAKITEAAVEQAAWGILAHLKALDEIIGGHNPATVQLDGHFDLREIARHALFAARTANDRGPEAKAPGAEITPEPEPDFGHGHDYIVHWQMDVHAASPELAARSAWRAMRAPGSMANAFLVLEAGQASVDVDLSEIDGGSS